MRLRNQNGSVALRLETKSTDAFVFVKKTRHKMPPINQNEINNLQSSCRDTIFIDWFNDNACRYFIMMQTKNSLAAYRIALNAFYGDETFEVIGDFYEKEHESHRKRIYNERYLKHNTPDSLLTETDFTHERYDIIFPDDPLSHCRRLGEVITMNAICSTGPQPNTSGEISSSEDRFMDEDKPF